MELKDIAALLGEVRLGVGSAAAAGSDNTDATELSKTASVVTGADGTKGVKIMATSDIGSIVVVHNADATNALKVYPPASGTLNGGTATTGSVAVAARETAFFIKLTSTAWHGGVAVNF